MTQDFACTTVLGKQAHSGLRNCFSSTVVRAKDKSEYGYYLILNSKYSKLQKYSLK